MSIRFRAALIAASLFAAVPGSFASEVPTPTATGTAAVPLATVWSGDRPPFGFSGGADSLDALIDQFLAAVKAGDMDAVRRLRVTKAEYENIIVPGEAPKGQPPRQTFQKANDVFFGMLDSRSRYAAENIVDRFKGKEFVRHELELSKGTREFIWFTGRGEVRLTLFDPEGNRLLLKTGWVAEVDGRYKFIGFNWND